MAQHDGAGRASSSAANFRSALQQHLRLLVVVMGPVISPIQIAFVFDKRVSAGRVKVPRKRFRLDVRERRAAQRGIQEWQAPTARFRRCNGNGIGVRKLLGTLREDRRWQGFLFLSAALAAGLARSRECKSKLRASTSMRNCGAAAMPILQLANSINDWITDGPNRLQENSTPKSTSLWKTVGRIRRESSDGCRL